MRIQALPRLLPHLLQVLWLLHLCAMYLYRRNWKYTVEICLKSGSNGEKYGMLTKSLSVATFITCIGKEALEIHNGLPFKSEEDKSDMTKVLELWETHCIGKTNIIYERYKFNNHSQEQT